MQVDPIKPNLKAPGTKRLKLAYGELVSSFAFKLKLRRYNKVVPKTAANFRALCTGEAVQVDPIKPKLKPPGTERLKLNHGVLLSTLAFKFNLHRYTPARRATASRAGADTRPLSAQLEPCLTHKNTLHTLHTP